MKKRIIFLVLGLFFLSPLAGCQTSDIIVSKAQNTPTATDSQRTLTICLGYEPESLYPYAVKTQAAWGVLEAIYDGPIDLHNYQAQPVILDALPSFGNQKVKTFKVSVNEGDRVSDVHGNPVLLKKGVEIFPYGCRNFNCAIHWDGTEGLQMEQIQATYRLLPGIKWSDGQPLTAKDSAFSFQVASDPATPAEKRNIEQTLAYKVLDEQTIEWTGIAGLLPQSFEDYFWFPLPEHAWGKYSASELLSSDAVNQKPIGWGAYQVEEWKKGSYIRLVKNPFYFRASEGLPVFDQLVFKFINKQGDTNLMAIRKGECDFSNQTTLMMDQTERLEYYLKYYSIPEIKALFGKGPLIEYLIFNARQPSSQNNQKSSIMSDVRMRQAVAYCADRKGLLKEFFNDLIGVPLSYVPEDNPLNIKNLESYEDDENLNKGQSILTALGWQDKDKSPDTPRTSSQIEGLADNTPLTIQLITDQSVWRMNVANVLSRNLAKCGFKVEVTAQKANEFLANGSQFWQGDFDLALFAWSSGKIPPCFLFSDTSQKLLDEPDPSLNLNVGQFANAEFDQLCSASLQPGVDEKTQQDLQARMQQIFNRELPALPIFPYFWADVARADFCPYQADISARSDLRDIESMNYGNQCAPKPIR